MNLINYILINYNKILFETLQHMKLIALSLPFSILIGVPIGIFISKNSKIANITLQIAGILMTIPSLALFGIMVVILAPIKAGIGTTPAVIALIIYSLMPIIRNTLIGIKSINIKIIESAKGMGMTSSQILLKIKLPLSIPIIMSGIRNAVVMGVGIATLGYFVSSGGLGYFIFAGLSRSRYEMVITGVILISFLGIMTNYLLIKLENLITSKGLKIK
ncbi:ABC transporter permease [Oceanotoga sp. DSM 15011]|uniref:Osmoprotectant transport system permease protein n=1 Tax=Oceanotoga teriensis TaxID=515440 RepID=A0AA45C7M5_9BACT|nr:MULTISPECIES: ABC transporter permease [Oceanotoga]PWJ95416.1 osmoprotectant transport system permease protein [Oceanotoga teriensis]UYP01055.1 ABC transporter permease [Oceanotoga sp. DSM 15011]